MGFSMQVQYTGRKNRLIIKHAKLSKMYVVSKDDGPFELAEEDREYMRMHYAHVLKAVKPVKAIKVKSEVKVKVAKK